MNDYSLAKEYNQQGAVLCARDKLEEALKYFEKAILVEG